MTITSYFGLKPCCDCGRTGNYTVNKNGYQFTVCADCVHNYSDEEKEEENTDEQKQDEEFKKENSRLNQIILGNEEEITDLRKDCEEYSKTFNRQNDEIVSLRKKMIKTKEIIRSLYFIIQGRIDYKGNIPLEDEMYRAKQFLEKEL